MSIDRLSNLIFSGSGVAFSQFWLLYGQSEAQKVVSRLVPKTDVPDVLGDLFVRLLTNLDQLRSSQRVFGWIARSARNTALNFLEYERLRAHGPIECVESAPAEVRLSPSAAAIAAVHRALESLPLQQQAVLRLYFFEARSFVAIGEAMGISRKKVPALLTRAMGSLRRELEDRAARDLDTEFALMPWLEA